MNSWFLFGRCCFFILLCAVVLSCGCFLFTKRYWSDPPAFPKGSEMESMGTLDYDWTFSTLDGQENSFGDFEGRVVFITIWATWCGTCQSQLPGLQRLYDSMWDTGVAFLLLSEQDGKTVQEFMGTNGYTVPAYVYEKKLPDVLRTDTPPATFIIDRKGSIVFSHIGTARWDAQECKHFLYHLLQ